MTRPIVAITMGDPAGIGPEIVMKTLAEEQVYVECRPLVIGDSSVLTRCASAIGMDVSLNPVSAPRDGVFRPGTVDLVDLRHGDFSDLDIGQVHRETGRASYEYVERAARLALSGQVDAVATAPLNKESLRRAGVPFIGHTEMLQEWSGVDECLTMFQVENLRIFFLTRHVSLRNACDRVTAGNLRNCLSRVSRALKDLGIPSPSVAVAGLNPHAGEYGMFGDEETTEMQPVIAELSRAGMKVEGPVPADSVFHLAREGRWDAVLSLYHDQGHIAAKMIDFEKTVSVTVGLPFIRTSVDHGTAFDIAWKGVASHVSMRQAVLVAAAYARSRKRTNTPSIGAQVNESKNITC